MVNYSSAFTCQPTPAHTRATSSMGRSGSGLLSTCPCHPRAGAGNKEQPPGCPNPKRASLGSPVPSSRKRHEVFCRALLSVPPRPDQPMGPLTAQCGPLPLRTVTNKLCLQWQSSPDLLVLPCLHNNKTYILKHGYKATILLPTIFGLRKGWS